MKERDMPRADFVTAVVLIVFAVVVVWMSLQMPTFENRGANPWSVPGIVPGLLGGIIGSLGIVLLVRSIRRQGHRLGLSVDKVRGWIRKPSSVRLYLTLITCLIYAWGLVGRIHYFLATLIFVFAFVMIFKLDPRASRAEKLKTTGFALLEAVVAAGAISALFRYVFLVNLP